MLRIFLLIALAGGTAHAVTTGGTPGATVTGRTTAEALCGPEIVLLGDAWEHVQLERDAILALSKSPDLTLIPQKTSALHSHLVFMQNRALMVFGDKRVKLDATITKVTDSFPRWNALALTGKGDALAAEWPVLSKDLATIAEQFPEEALVSSSEASFVLPPVVPTLQIRQDNPLPRLEAGKETEFRFRLIGGDGKPVIPDNLHTTHTEKLHALLLDPLFTDYHHEHPQPTETPGEYVFRFTPAHSTPYRLWLDAMPVATGRGEFPVADLLPIPRPIAKAPAPSAPVTEAVVDGFRVRLELPPEGLLFGGTGVVSATLEDPEGKPLTRVQPLMGAFAHVVGFADDFHTILHIHPLGAMPAADQLGGPKIDFQLRPIQPGWLRLYLQFQVDGKVRLATFVVPVTVK